MEWLGRVLPSTTSARIRRCRRTIPIRRGDAAAPGTNTERDGTGWQTFEVQGVYAPMRGDWTGGAHTLALGYHQNEYRARESGLRTPATGAIAPGRLRRTFSARRACRRSMRRISGNSTDRWSLTLGARYEDWSAIRRRSARRAAAAIDYADRATAPSHRKHRWRSRRTIVGSCGSAQAAEFAFRPSPNCSRARDRDSIIVNDPNLHPKSRTRSISLSSAASVGTAARFAVPGRRARQHLRADEHHRDAERDQRSERRSGAHARHRDCVLLAAAGIETLRFDGSVAYTRSRILRNDNYPVSVGNDLAARAELARQFAGCLAADAIVA